MPNTITTVEAGCRLGIPTVEVYRLIDAGRLPFTKNGRGLVRVSASDVEALRRG